MSTKDKAEDIEKLLLPEVGKGEYRRLIMRVPGFGRSSKQVNSGFIIVLLEPWKKRDRHGVKIMRESFGKISQVPGVLAFPVMPQGIRTGGIQNPIQFVILGNTYDQLIKWNVENFLTFLYKKDPHSLVVTYTSTDPKNSFAIVEGCKVTSLVEKKPVSNAALIGFHYWKRGKDFVDSAHK